MIPNVARVVYLVVIFVVKDRFDSIRLHSKPWVYTEEETEAEGLWNGRNRLVSTMSPNNSEANSMVARQHWPNKDRCWNGQRDHQDWPRRKFSSLSPVLATLPSLLLSSRRCGSLCHYGSLSLASLSTKRTSVLRTYVPVPREPVDKWMRRNPGWIKEWTMLEWTVAEAEGWNSARRSLRKARPWKMLWGSKMVLRVFSFYGQFSTWCFFG